MAEGSISLKYLQTFNYLTILTLKFVTCLVIDVIPITDFMID